FNLKNLFDSLMKNQNTKNAADVFYQEKGWRLEELVKKMDEQIHIVFSGFVIPEGGHGYEIFQPEMSFVLKKKNSQDLETNEKIKQIASFYFSDFGWEEKQDMQNKLVYLTEKQSGFTLVFYKEWVVFATSLVQGESVISQIQKKKASLYDVFHRYIEGNPEGFLAVNPQKLLVQFENVLKEYALYKLLMDEAEYKENFGKLIDVFKDWKPFFLQYNYDKTDKKYHGKIQFLK
ncbi:MAG TPA: hypothetical protein DHW82_13600, partial [Spirochaetia bacterium]|nr:hypothetical protein [Spirochaetia bacterium]